MKRIRGQISITHGLFVVTLTIAVVLATAIVLYTRHKSTEQALIAASELMDQSVEIVRLRADALVNPIDAVIAFSQYWSEAPTPPTEEGHPARHRFMSLIRQLPQISALQLGYDDGAFYLLGPTAQRPKAQLEELDAPPEAVFIEDVILRSDQSTARSIQRLLDEEGNVLKERIAEDETFDPRERPWYKLAHRKSGVVRTHVYMFAIAGVPGITVSRLDGEVVVGADIALPELERFLNSLPQSELGILAILRDDGSIVVKSKHAHEEVVATASLIRSVSAAAPRDIQTIEAGGIDWIARTAPISIGPTKTSMGGGSTETIIIAMPLDVVVGPIDRESQNSVLVSLGLVLVSIPLIWLVARRLSRPLLRLVVQADEIRDFELGEVGRSLSFVDEIGRLERAMDQMRAHLRTFALYVPKALVKQLIQQGETPRLGGSNRDLTILFLDLENFTAMSENLAPEEVMQRMSRFFEVVTQTLLLHDATIDKYIGDAVMAFWNAPNDTEHHTQRACLAALRLIEAARQET
ncbi:MAG: adenylate/guanylate cyclase domain-containing protein, partial [Pseudomonadota bacterium]